jgi:hypothetical protein
MEMLLMGFCVSLFALAVVAIAFRASTRAEPSDSDVRRDLPLVKTVAQVHLSPDRIAVPPVVQHQQVPIELLLLQIENHVRLEQAVAESFIEFPTHALLHSKTASPFVN